MTQHDGPNPHPNRGQPAGHDQRERPWPAVADVDWWREEAAEYVPARRPTADLTPDPDPASDADPGEPALGSPAEDPEDRDPEIDFTLDGPPTTAPPLPDTGAPPTADPAAVDPGLATVDPTGASPTPGRTPEDTARTTVDTARPTVDTARPTVDTGLAGPPAGATAALIRERLAAAALASARRPAPPSASLTPDSGARDGDDPSEPAPDHPTTSGFPAGAGDPGEPADPGPPDQARVGTPWAGTLADEVPDDPDAGSDPEADGEPQPGGIGRATSPYARPPRVTRREIAPAPRRVPPMPPAIITAPTPAIPVSGPPASTVDESIVDAVEVDADATTLLPPAEGLSIFDTTEVGAIPALPKPRRAPAPPPTRRARRARRRRRTGPWVGLPVLVVLLLASAFVAWVSAEPFWLDVGHGATGTATVVSRDQRCRVAFAAADGAFTTSTVDLVGLPKDQCVVGADVDARMVSANAARAYSADPTGLRLRWGVGLAALLACAWGIGWGTGAARFTGLQRLLAIALSAAGPLAVAATMLLISH